VLFGIAAVSAPFDQEVLSNPTNVGWFIAVWLSLVSVMRLPRQSWKVVLLGLLGCAAVFATPLATINVPLWLLRAWRGVRRSDRAEVGFAIILLTAVVLVLQLTGSLGSRPRLGHGTEGYAVLQAPGTYLQKYACVVSYQATRLVLAPWMLDRVDAAGHGAVAAVAGFVPLVLIAVCAAARFRSLVGLLLAIVLFAMSFMVLLLGRPQYYAYASCDHFVYRYAIYPAAMFGIALVAAFDGLPRGRLRTVAALGVLTLLASAWHGQFFVKPFIDQHWAAWTTRLERKLATRSLAPLSIPMNPPWVTLEFDAANRLPEVDVPAETIVGSLGIHGMFRQSFVSRCDPLMTVEMRLGAFKPSNRGGLTFSLMQDSSGALVASTTTPRSEMDLDGSWQLFEFDPIEGSAGQRYTIVLRAVDNDLDASLLILGSQKDWYPEGEAFFAGQWLPGDASFRYGCQERPTR
jgi:hypothetical protein